MIISFVVYIIYSKRLNRYYIGETINLRQRLGYHNDINLNSNSTRIGIPWIVYLKIQVKDRIQARKIESHIKKMKSKIYIENLKKYPEMIEGLKRRFCL